MNRLRRVGRGLRQYVAALGALALIGFGAPLVSAQTSTPATTAAAKPAADEKTVEVNRAATVTLVEGEVAAYSSAKVKRKLAVGDEVVEGDSIVTGKDGELHLDMADGGFMSVRPNTKMRIVKYQAKGEASDSGVFGLLEGSFRSITGWIGKYNRNSYVVKTPTATIGVRGTDHEPFVIPKGSSEGEPGTYDKVNEGGSFIKTPTGRAEIAANQSGFVSHDKAAKPRVLAAVPKHFRAARNERVFGGKHAEVQARIEQRREERRSAIKQKLQQGKAEAATRREQRQQAIKEKREAAVKQRATDRENVREKAREKAADEAPHDKREHARKEGHKLHTSK